jgi:N-dimethylarginine dimethylaminohydrolase
MIEGHMGIIGLIVKMYKHEYFKAESSSLHFHKGFAFLSDHSATFTMDIVLDRRTRHCRTYWPQTGRIS